MVFKARDRRDYCQTIIGFYVTEFVTENVTDCDVSWLTWHPLLNISNHSNTPPDSLTCRRPLAHKKLTDMPILGGLSGSNNTTTAFWTHSFSLFCQKYLLIVCVCAAKFLSHNSKGAWNKKLISWLRWSRFLCRGRWSGLTRGSEGSGWMRELLTSIVSSSKPRLLTNLNEYKIRLNEISIWVNFIFIEYSCTIDMRMSLIDFWQLPQ